VPAHNKLWKTFVFARFFTAESGDAPGDAWSQRLFGHLTDEGMVTAF